MRIPSHAKRVFKGKIFDVYHWKQKGFNGKYETYERIKRKYTALVLPTTKNKKIIINKEKQPRRPILYGLFGGRVERNEKPIKAAKRELLEEAGLTSKEIKLLKSYTPTDAIDWKIYFFVAKDCKKAANPKHEPGEKIKIIKVNFQKFLSIIKSNKFHPGPIKEDLISIIKNKSKLKKFKKLLFS